uniref:Capsid protein n=1 Tax=Mops bat astrovirus TaxID=3141890 RepID=A0AAU7E2A0_9VIRU
MNPGLGSLERVGETATVTLKTDDKGAIEMEISEAPNLLRLFSDPTVREADKTGTGETIWQIVDQTANAISSVTPVPFGWLIKGGWWFVKKLAGRTRNGVERLQVYASLADAQNDRPAIATTPGQSGNAVQTQLQVTQVNQPNLGAAPSASPGIVASGPVYPMDPSQLGESFDVVGSIRRISRYDSKPWPLMFMDDLLAYDNHSYSAAVLKVDSASLFKTVGSGANQSLICFSNKFPWPSNYSGFKFKSKYMHSGANVDLKVAAYFSEKITSSIWLNAIVVSTEVQNHSFNKTLVTSVRCFDFQPNSSNTEDWNYVAQIYSNKSLNIDVSDFEGPHVVLFTTNSELKPSSITAQASWNSGVDVAPCSWIKGMLFPGGIETGSFGGRFKQWSPTQSAREKLAVRLGMTLNELEEALNQTDSEDDDDGDSFEQVSEPASGEYLSLRESGLTHAEALEVLSCRK